MRERVTQLRKQRTKLAEKRVTFLEAIFILVVALASGYANATYAASNCTPDMALVKYANDWKKKREERLDVCRL